MRTNVLNTLAASAPFLKVAPFLLMVVLPLLLGMGSAPTAVDRVQTLVTRGQEIESFDDLTPEDLASSPRMEDPLPPITTRIVSIMNDADLRTRDNAIKETLDRGGEIIFGTAIPDIDYAQVLDRIAASDSEVGPRVDGKEVKSNDDKPLFPFRYTGISSRLDALSADMVKRHESELLELAGMIALRSEGEEQVAGGRFAMGIVTRVYEATESCDARASALSLYLASYYALDIEAAYRGDLARFTDHSIVQCSSRDDVKYLVAFLKYLETQNKRGRLRYGAGILADDSVGWNTVDSTPPEELIAQIEDTLDSLEGRSLSPAWRDRLRGDLLLEQAIGHNQSPLTARVLASKAARSYGASLKIIDSSVMRLVYAHSLVMTGRRERAAEIMRSVTPENLAPDQHGMAFSVLTQTGASDAQVLAFAGTAPNDTNGRLGFSTQDCIPPSSVFSVNLSVSNAGFPRVPRNLDVTGDGNACGGEALASYQSWLPRSRYFEGMTIRPHALTKGEARDALSGRPSGDGLLIQVDWLRVRGRFDEALRLLETAASTSERIIQLSKSEIEWLIAETLLLAGRPREAREAFESYGFSPSISDEPDTIDWDEMGSEVVRKGPSRHDVQLQYAYTLKLTGEPEAARSILSRSSLKGLAAIEIGLLDMERGDRHSALRVFESGLDQRDIDKYPIARVPMLHNAAAAAYGVGDYDSAMSYARRALELDPWNSLAMEALADISRFTSVATVENMIVAYRRVLALNPTHFSSWNNLGVLYANRGEIDKAEEAFVEAIRLRCAANRAGSVVDIGMDGGITISSVGDSASVSEDSRCSFAAAWHNLGVLWSQKGRVEDVVASQGALGIAGRQDGVMADKNLGFQFDEDPYQSGVDFASLSSSIPQLGSGASYGSQAPFIFLGVWFLGQLMRELAPAWLVGRVDSAVVRRGSKSCMSSVSVFIWAALITSVVSVALALRATWGLEAAPLLIFCVGVCLLGYESCRVMLASSKPVVSFSGAVGSGLGALMGAPFVWAPKFEQRVGVKGAWVPGTVLFILYYVVTGVAMACHVPFLRDCVAAAGAWCAANFVLPNDDSEDGVQRWGSIVVSAYGVCVCCLGVLRVF